MCGYFRIGFTDFMLKGKSLLDIHIYFLLQNMERMIKNNTKIFLTTKKVKMERSNWHICGKYKKNSKIVKYRTFSKKH